MTPPTDPARARGQRAVGMALLGSSIALATLAALAFAGTLPFPESARVWATAGMGLAAVLDALIGLYFLRAASQS